MSITDTRRLNRWVHQKKFIYSSLRDKPVGDTVLAMLALWKIKKVIKVHILGH